MQAKIKYEFSGIMWRHDAPGGWHFISVPNEISKEIRELLKWQEEGWGRLKASAQIAGQKWDTAIWFDTKKDSYILPIKSEIRKKGNLTIDIMYDLALWL